jgi:hypothetical protein
VYDLIYIPNILCEKVEKRGYFACKWNWYAGENNFLNGEK